MKFPAGMWDGGWRDLLWISGTIRTAHTVGNKRYLCGIREALVDEWEQSLGPEFFCEDALAFFNEALQRIVWHRAQGHRLFIVSGTLAPLARVVARRLRAWFPWRSRCAQRNWKPRPVLREFGMDGSRRAHERIAKLRRLRSSLRVTGLILRGVMRTATASAMCRCSKLWDMALR